MEKAFRDAINNSKDNINITDDEKEKFLKAMKEPEFRKMLSDYMEEISDPKYRSEQEAYLDQLEKDNNIPSDKELFIPNEGFVMKSRMSDKTKVFINICHSEKVDIPTCEPVKGKHGSNWSLPYILGPQRVEKDNAGNPVPTFDICYNQLSLEKCFYPEFKKLVLDTSISAVENYLQSSLKSSVTIDKNYRILKGVKYKSGKPVTMCISKQSRELHSNDTMKEMNKFPSIEDDKPCEVKESASPKSKKKPIPEYKIIQRGKFDLSQHTISGSNESLPESLVIRVSLEKLNSSNEVELNVSSEMVLVRSPVYESLEIKLPYCVDENKGTAKFDKVKKTLEIVLKLLPPENKDVIKDVSYEKVEGVRDAEDSNQLEELDAEELPKDYQNENLISDSSIDKNKMESEIRHERWVAKDALSNQHKSPVLEECKERASMSKEDPGKPENYDSRIDEVDTLSEKKQLNEAEIQGVDPQTPTYSYRQTKSCITVLLEVSNADASSVSVKFQNSSVSINFTSNHNNSEKYSLNLQLFKHIVPSKCSIDISTHNVLMILQKSTEERWEKLERDKQNLDSCEVMPQVNQSSNKDTGFSQESVTGIERKEVGKIENSVRNTPPTICFSNELMYELD